MTDVDCLDLLAQGTGICFKIGAEGSFGVAAQGKGCFLCPTNSLIYQGLSDVCSCKEFKFRATADSYCYLACVKNGDQ